MKATTTTYEEGSKWMTTTTQQHLDIYSFERSQHFAYVVLFLSVFPSVGFYLQQKQSTPRITNVQCDSQCAAHFGIRFVRPNDSLYFFYFLFVLYARAILFHRFLYFCCTFLHICSARSIHRWFKSFYRHFSIFVFFFFGFSLLFHWSSTRMQKPKLKSWFVHRSNRFCLLMLPFSFLFDRALALGVCVCVSSFSFIDCCFCFVIFSISYFASIVLTLDLICSNRLAHTHTEREHGVLDYRSKVTSLFNIGPQGIHVHIKYTHSHTIFFFFSPRVHSCHHLHFQITFIHFNQFYVYRNESHSLRL